MWQRRDSVFTQHECWWGAAWNLGALKADATLWMTNSYRVQKCSGDWETLTGSILWGNLGISLQWCVWVECDCVVKIPCDISTHSWGSGKWFGKLRFLALFLKESQVLYYYFESQMSPHLLEDLFAFVYLLYWELNPGPCLHTISKHIDPRLGDSL